jgi:hypothetical protein
MRSICTTAPQRHWPLAESPERGNSARRDGPRARRAVTEPSRRSDSVAPSTVAGVWRPQRLESVKTCLCQRTVERRQWIQERPPFGRHC